LFLIIFSFIIFLATGSILDVGSSKNNKSGLVSDAIA